MGHQMYKNCTFCNESKPATSEFFHRQAAKIDGLKNICKVCVKYDRENYPPQPLTGDRLRLQIEREDLQRAKENRTRDLAAAVKTFKAKLLQGAKDADYASKGIMIDGLLSDVAIKVCIRCEEQYPETADYFHADSRSGKYRGVCKICAKKHLQSIA